MTNDKFIDELNLPKIVQPYAEYLNMEILPTDAMYAGNKHHYFSCGASALACVLHSHGISGNEKPNIILDFGCGAGRVTRWLRAAYPKAIIHACDLREQDLEFVQNICQATTWVFGYVLRTACLKNVKNCKSLSASLNWEATKIMGGY